MRCEKNYGNQFDYHQNQPHKRPVVVATKVLANSKKPKYPDHRVLEKKSMCWQALIIGEIINSFMDENNAMTSKGEESWQYVAVLLWHRLG